MPAGRRRYKHNGEAYSASPFLCAGLGSAIRV